MMHLYTEGVWHSVVRALSPMGISVWLPGLFGAVISLTNQVDRPIAAT